MVRIILNLFECKILLSVYINHVKVNTIFTYDMYVCMHVHVDIYNICSNFGTLHSGPRFYDKDRCVNTNDEATTTLLKILER